MDQPASPPPSSPASPPPSSSVATGFTGRLLKVLRVRRALVLALAVGVLSGVLAPDVRSVVTRGLVGWNAGVWLYLAVVARMMMRADHGKLTRNAVAHAEGARVVLTVVVTAALISVAAVVLEVSAARGAGARAAAPHLLFAWLTVAGSWVLIPMLFTLNYASLFYVQPGGGLRFPEADDAAFRPDYGDFAYFAFTIAVASQTSDVVVDTRAMRRLTLVQSILSFVFNTTVLALTINLAAGLF